MQSNLLQQGVELMLFGMGTVFTFLALLVLATVLMSRIIGRWLPDETTPSTSPSPLATSDDARLKVVIAAAIHQHRNKRD